MVVWQLFILSQVFSGETFYPMASLTATVPVLACCAISKR